MTREEAFLLFDLPETADMPTIERRYFILTKKYRSQNDKEKLEAIAKAYDVLNGRAEAERKKTEEYQKAKKYFGKSLFEWKVYFGYTWLRNLLLIVIAVVLGSLIYTIVTKPKEDLRVIAIGHYYMDNTILSDYAKTQKSFNSPSVVGFDVVWDDTAEQTDMSLEARMVSGVQIQTIKQDVVLTDRMSMPTYVAYMAPMDDLYEELLQELPEEIMEYITPIRLRRADYLGESASGKRETNQEDQELHIYGLLVKDIKFINAYGLNPMWVPYENPEKEFDPTLRDPSLIFSIYAFSEEPGRGSQFIKDILLDHSYFLEKMEERIAASQS